MWGTDLTPRPTGVREGTVLLLPEVTGTVDVRPWRNAGSVTWGETWHNYPCFFLILPFILPWMALFGGIRWEVRRHGRLLVHKTEPMRMCGGAGRTDRNHHREAAPGLRPWTFESSLVVNCVGVFQVEQTGKGYFTQMEQHVQRHGVAKEPGSHLIVYLIMIVCLIDWLCSKTLERYKARKLKVELPPTPDPSCPTHLPEATFLSRLLLLLEIVSANAS